MDSGGGPEIALSLLFLFFIAIGIGSLVLWIWSIIHCVNNKELSDTNRIIGIVLIVVLGLLGSLIYLFLPRDQVPPQGRYDRGAPPPGTP